MTTRADVETRTLTPEDAAAEIAGRAMAVAASRGRRVVVGIAGGPGSGKSTLAASVIELMNEMIDGSAARVPMDGFHIKHERLVELDLVEKKGAPETFDGAAFVAFLKKLKSATAPVPAPSYSRRIEDVVENAFTIAANVPILVVEGNYLLLGRPPWNGIRPLLDIAVFIAVPRAMVRERLLKRHAEHGLFTKERNIRHVDTVDLANYDLVHQSRGKADLVIEMATEN